MTQLSLSDADKATLAATDDGARVTLLKDLFNRCHGAAPEHVALAGGRVNLIGEHVDYPDVQFNNDPVVHLYSMGGAIQNSYLALVAARSDKKIVLCHTAVGEVFTVELAKLAQLEEEAVKQRADGLAMAERSTPVWANHTLGAVALMISSGAPCEGLSLLLTSNVPPGAGMSNSAANCVALGLVFNELYPTLALDTQMKVVTFARDAENSKFGGGHCGWLDQMLIACSKEHMLTKIDYADHSIEHFTSQLPKETQFVALNTNVPHVLAESDYSHRVRELTVGIAFLSKILGENAGGPLLKLSSLNRLIAAVDPANPASKPVRLENIKMGALAAAAPDGSPKFPSIKAELAEPEPLGHQKIQEIVAAAKGDAYDPPSDLPMHKGKTKLESLGVLLRRMRHQKMSSLLVPLAGAAAAQGDSALFGTLLDLEGESLRMSGDFQITGDNGAQDALLDCAFEVGAEIAADTSVEFSVHGRMLGGGGGGNVLLMVVTGDATLRTKWEERVKDYYQEWADAKYPGQGIRATVIIPAMSAGARVLP